MEDRSMSLERHAAQIEAPVSGTVVRVAVRSASSVREVFVWERDFPVDPIAYAGWFGAEARLVGSSRVSAASGWGPFVLFTRGFSRDVGGGNTLQRLFAGNRAPERVSLEVNLAHVVPMEEDRVWALLGEARGVGTAREHEMAAVLDGLPAREIESFCARLEEWAERIDTEEALGVAGSGYVRGSDGFRAWRMAVIASGRELFQVVGGGNAAVGEGLDEEFGFALGSLGARVIENRTGATPVFKYDPADPPVGPKRRRGALEEQRRKRKGDGTVDLFPGPRDARSMYSRGLVPTAVVSRAFAERENGFVEFLVAQHIDPYREEVARHVREGSARASQELGGEIRTPIEWYDVTTDILQPGMAVFEIRRSWKGSLDDYLVEYDLV